MVKTTAKMRIAYYKTIAAPVSFERIKQAIFDAFTESDLKIDSLDDIEVSKRADGNYSIFVLGDHREFPLNKFMAAKARLGHRFTLQGQIKVGNNDAGGTITYKFVVSEINTDKV